MLKKRGCGLVSTRKAQMTVFMIIGIVMVVLFGTAYYASQAMQKLNLQAEADTIVLNALQATPLRQFVTSCVDKEIKDGLRLIGGQGGNIYVDQGGLIERLSPPGRPFEFFVIGNTYIKYGLLNQEYGFFLPPPLYPATAWNPSYMRISELDVWPYFGENNMRPLCDPLGENAPGKSMVVCRSYGENSIQSQLRDYVSKNLPTCANFTQISEAFNFTPGNPLVSVLLTENALSINVKYPINVKVKGSDNVISLADFSSVINIRLKKIYEFTDELITNDAYDVKFDLTKDYRKFGAAEGNFTISTAGAVTGTGENITAELTASQIVSVSGQYGGLWDPFLSANKSIPYMNFESTGCRDLLRDSIVEVIDKASLIKGSPFSFKFAVQQRNPVLDWIHFAPAGSEFDIFAVEGSNLTINPKAYDPDELPEEEIKFTYSGWKEDYDEKFKGSADPLCGGCLRSVDCRTNTSRFRDLCIEKIDSTPHNWTRSLLYVTTKKTSQLDNLTSKDIGPHILNITVTDDNGCTDWQEIKVLVTDVAKPNGSASGTGFTGLPAGFASIEDPYVLNASFSTLVFGSLRYDWLDAFEPFNFTTSDPVNYVKLPPGNISIKDTGPKKNFVGQSEDNKIFTKPGEHKILLLTNGLSTSFNTTVFKCLPYRGKGLLVGDGTAAVFTAESSAPYPYNKAGTDPFNAPHVCCAGYNPGKAEWTMSDVKAYDDGLKGTAGSVDYASRGIVEPLDVGNGNPLQGAWGTYRGTDQVCYQDTEAKTGSLIEILANSSDNSALLKDYMMELRDLGIDINNAVTWEVDISGYGTQTLLGQTTNKANFTTPDAALQSIPTALTNDRWTKTFVRYCSGVRGNTCGGPGKIVLKWIAPVFDLGSGEIARCITAKGTALINQSGNETSFEKEILLKYNPTTYSNFYFYSDASSLSGIQSGYCVDTPILTKSTAQPNLLCKGRCKPVTTGTATPDNDNCQNKVECACYGLDSSPECSQLPEGLLDKSLKEVIDFMATSQYNYLQQIKQAPTSYCNNKNEILKCTSNCKAESMGTFARGLAGCNADQACAGKMEGQAPSTAYLLFTQSSWTTIALPSLFCNSTGKVQSCFPYTAKTPYNNLQPCNNNAASRIQDTATGVLFSQEGANVYYCSGKVLDSSSPQIEIQLKDANLLTYRTMTLKTSVDTAKSGKCTSHCGLATIATDSNSKCEGVIPGYYTDNSASATGTSKDSCDTSCVYHAGAAVCSWAGWNILTATSLPTGCTNCGSNKYLTGGDFNGKCSLACNAPVYCNGEIAGGTNCGTDCELNCGITLGSTRKICGSGTTAGKKLTIMTTSSGCSLGSFSLRIQTTTTPNTFWIKYGTNNNVQQLTSAVSGANSPGAFSTCTFKYWYSL